MVHLHENWGKSGRRVRQREGGNVFHTNELAHRLTSCNSRLQTWIHCVIFCLRYFAHFRSIMAAVNKVLMNMFMASFEFFFTRSCETNTK